MAITEPIWKAKLFLKWLEWKRSNLIKVVNAAHRKWSVLAENTKSNPNARRAAFLAWQAQLHFLHQREQQIAEYSEYVNKGAITASLDLAKACGVWEGGQGRDGMFHPYQDVVGVWTIGFGHTAADGRPVPGPSTPPLTMSEAATLLLHDLSTFYAPSVHNALRKYRWIVNQKEFDALTDFAYNLGPGYFSPNHDIGFAMSKRDARATANAILLYDRAGGHKLSGLTHRREWERQLFLGGTYVV